MHPNIRILTVAAECLGELTEELVFLGGCATGLLITDTAAPEIRVTRDVDAIAQITMRMDFVEALSGHLPADAASQKRVAVVVDWIRQLTTQHRKSK